MTKYTLKIDVSDKSGMKPDFMENEFWRQGIIEGVTIKSEREIHIQTSDLTPREKTALVLGLFANPFVEVIEAPTTKPVDMV